MSIKKTQEIKQLNTRKTKLNVDLKGIQAEQNRLRAEESKVQKTINNIDKQLEALQSDNEIIVTEHALLRYLERVKGINLDNIRDEIMTEKMKESLETLPATGKFPIEGQNGYRAVLKNGAVVSVVES